MDQINMWEIEESHFGNGIQIICGVDEAGRGPLAGPVCAAAVILPPNAEIPGLNDSKKLTDKKRRELFPIIKEKAIAYGIAFASTEAAAMLALRLSPLTTVWQGMPKSVSRLPSIRASSGLTESARMARSIAR